jgi:hypothetical protein
MAEPVKHLVRDACSTDDIDRQIADLNERLTTLDRERLELADRLRALELTRAKVSMNPRPLLGARVTTAGWHEGG